MNDKKTFYIITDGEKILHDHIFKTRNEAIKYSYVFRPIDYRIVELTQTEPLKWQPRTYQWDDLK